MASRWRWPAGQQDAGLADHRVVAVRKRGDELVRVRGGRRFDHPLFVSVRPAVRDVVSYGVVEEDDLLRDEPHQRAQRVQSHVADVDGRRP